MLAENTEKTQATGSPELARKLAWAAAALAWVGILLAYRHQVALIVEAWETLPSHAHGYVVLLVVAYLGWGKRDVLAGTPLAPSGTGVIALLLTGAAGFAGELVAAGVVVQFALVVMLQSAVWAVLGWRAFRILAGPLCFLFFAIPFGHDILPTLMDWTANATVVGLRASGVPVLQQDRFFIIPSGSWSVVEACSGIRYLLTSLFVGTIFAYITYVRWYKRLIFVLWMIVLPLLANWLRAYTIVMAAHLSNNQWGLGLSHLAFGWVIFAVTMIGSFTIGARWRDPEPVIEPRPAGRAASCALTLGAAAGAVLLAFAWNQSAYFLLNQAPRSAPVLALENSLTALEKVEPALPMVVPGFVGATAMHEGNYRFGDGDLGLTVAYYRNQQQGAELINVKNVLEPTHAWGWRSSRRLPAMAAGIPELRLEYYARAEAKAVVATVYWIGGRTTTNDIVGKIYQAVNRVSGKGDDGAMIVITATDRSSEDVARARVDAFVRERLPELLRDLDAIQTQGRQ